MLPPLPNTWFRTSAERARGLHAELELELSPQHRLANVPLELVADRDGASDDVLFRRLDKPECFVVVHLTWRGSVETNPEFPTVDFEGTFDEFVEVNRWGWGFDPETA